MKQHYKEFCSQGDTWQMHIFNHNSKQRYKPEFYLYEIMEEASWSLMPGIIKRIHEKEAFLSLVHS
jgi:hypothetical protein